MYFIVHAAFVRIKLMMMMMIAVKNSRISDFRGLVTLTLTLDRVILHTVMHHSSTSTYIPNFIEIETFCGGTNGRIQTGGRTFETHFISSTQEEST